MIRANCRYLVKGKELLMKGSLLMTNRTITMKRKRQEKVELPASFREKHVAEFIEGCDRILEVDPTLLDTMISKDFPLFLKKEQTEMTLDHHFAKLGSSILAQQISGNAAMAVKKKFMALFDDVFPTYKQLRDVLKQDDGTEKLRACGLSQRKVIYMGSLAEYFEKNEGEILDLFTKESNDVIEKELVDKIKGIGPWSAQMFLVTSLERMDVFASGDLGVARGCSKYLDARPEFLKDLMTKRTEIRRSKIKHKKLNWKVYDEDIVEKCGEAFAPFRTIFMFLLWRVSSTNVEVIEKNENNYVNGT
ncbi:LAMI_0H12530g1_1 [Lachancea mirantina]|uniref:LAMI_0H12530g1_1 n=1 Tax=Lachancea mirantina TaxID=1230905 RepID=A0A1G4KHU8_9SACH|nr:LAMI_0H12530g1_1 [Lachancea mirantina]